MMKKWKYAMMAAATALLIPAFASRAEMPPIGMPNPLVEYKTYHALAEATDSRPLFLPKGTLLAGQCHLTDYIAIGGKLSDIRYRMDDGSTLSVRTARMEGEGAGKKYQRSLYRSLGIAHDRCDGGHDSEDDGWLTRCFLDGRGVCVLYCRKQDER